YDDLGRRIGIGRANGTQSGYAYDDASQLREVVQDLGGTARDLTIGLTRNAAGQIVQRRASNSEYSWT
ncbi:hypothetical protein, partial [Klebsiella pneumoniae]